MSTHTRLTAVAAAILFSTAGVAAAQEAPGTQDNEAGVSLSPSEAGGSWTLESGGHSICVLKLGTAKVAGGAFKVDAPAACGDALPAGVTGWTPSDHGMDLVDADGRTLVGFGRWSNSLLVSHQSSGVDIQLKRGA